jgi:hypothetical protein
MSDTTQSTNAETTLRLKVEELADIFEIPRETLTNYLSTFPTPLPSTLYEADAVRTALEVVGSWLQKQERELSTPGIVPDPALDWRDRTYKGIDIKTLLNVCPGPS